MQAIIRLQAAIDSPSNMPEAPPFTFEMSDEAAIKNLQVFKSNNFDLESVINSAPASICKQGSEFRDETILEGLLGKHTNWKEIRSIIYDGASNHLTHEPRDQDRLLENAALVLYNNHKGARDNPGVIMSSIEDDVNKGYAIMLPKGAELVIPGSMICPVGAVTQKTLDEAGHVTCKARLTHDQTFTRLEDSESVNKLTNKLKFIGLCYGWCFLRIVAQAIEMRRAYPNTRIIVIKGDFKSAYRRIHYLAKAAVQCMVSWMGYIFMWLRLSFGGSACPSCWCVVGEAMVDLANDLLLNQDFKVDSIVSRYFESILDSEYLSDDIPFGFALPTVTRPPTREQGTIDIFVDDMIGICVDIDQNPRRMCQAMLASVDGCCRPPNNEERPPRSDDIHMSKTVIEGAPREVALILGWSFCFRTMVVQLPKDKFQAWTSEINRILQIGKLRKHELESLVGKLGHASTAIPMSRYFLGRFYTNLKLYRNDFELRHLKADDIKALELWKRFLLRAKQGISMNLLTNRIPTHITVTDACPTGIGGFSVTTGRAWRIKFIEKPKVPNNTLEYLACVIGIWIEQLNGEIRPDDIVLALTDNSSAAGWLHRCNCDARIDKPKTEIAQHLAKLSMDFFFTIHPQHLPGKDNGAADALSRLFDLDDDELTHLICTKHKQQVLANFHIVPLPKEILSWICSVLALPPSPSSPRLLPTQTPKIVHGIDGPSSSPSPDFARISSLIPSSPPFAGNLDDASLKHAEKEYLEAEDIEMPWSMKVRNSFWAGESARPLAAWLRNSGVTAGIHPSTSRGKITGSLLASDPCSKPGQT